jgi:hypothetical protein
VAGMGEAEVEVGMPWVASPGVPSGVVSEADFTEAAVSMEAASPLDSVVGVTRITMVIRITGVTRITPTVPITTATILTHTAVPIHTPIRRNIRGNLKGNIKDNLDLLHGSLLIRHSLRRRLETIKDIT